MSALFGFLGVIAGALVTGTITGVLAHMQHGLQGRVAARVLYATLLDARKRIDAVLRTERVGPSSHDWAVELVPPWQEHRDNFARAGGSSLDFREVATAFAMVSAIIAMRHNLIETDGTPEGEAQDVTDALEGCRAQIEIACPILERASLTRAERKAARLPVPLGFL